MNTPKLGLETTYIPNTPEGELEYYKNKCQELELKVDFLNAKNAKLEFDVQNLRNVFLQFFVSHFWLTFI